MSVKSHLHFHTVFGLLCITLLAILLTACNSKTDQEFVQDQAASPAVLTAMTTPQPDATYTLPQPYPYPYPAPGTGEQLYVPYPSPTEFEPSPCSARPLPVQADSSLSISETISATVVHLPHPIEQKVYAYTFVDPQRGWVANEHALFTTEDGGQTWNWLSDLVSPTLDLDFISAQRGWLVKETGLFSTEDGGETWQNLPLPDLGMTETLKVSGVDFVDEERGWVKVWLGQEKTLHTNDGGWVKVWLSQVRALRTGDGGRNWQPVDLPCPQDLHYLDAYGAYYDFSLVGSQDVWLVCGGSPAGAGSLAFKQIFRSRDDGQTWEAISESSPETFFATKQPGEKSTGLSDGYWPDLFFLNNQYGWMGTGRGGLRSTVDGGLTWQFIRVPVPEANIANPVFLSPSTGFAQSPLNPPILFKTEDGGENWYQIFPPLLPDRVWFVNSSLGYGIGGWLYRTKLMSTVDGGRTWQIVPHEILQGEDANDYLEGGKYCFSYIWTLAFLDQDNGWMLAALCGHYASKNGLFRTRNSGKTWQFLPESIIPGKYFYSLSFVDEQTGYLGNSNGRLYRTHDGGNTLQPLDLIDRKISASFQFTNLLEGGKTEDGQLFLTVDGGCSWTLVFQKYRVRAFDILPGGHIWIEVYEPGEERFNFDGRMLYSSDYGQHWKMFKANFRTPFSPSVANHVLSGFIFLDSKHGWTSFYNHLYTTTDGGYTWEQIR